MSIYRLKAGSIMEVRPSLEHLNLDENETKMRLMFTQELGFFEVLADLAKKTKVHITVPETFIMGFGFVQPTLICTNYDTGELFIRENITKVGISESCSFFEDLTRSKGHLPIAIHKTASTAYYHDTCRPVFSSLEACSLWNSALTQSRPQVLQRYVTGLSKHAALIRATWDASTNRVKKTLFKNSLPLRTSLLGPKPFKDKSRIRSLELSRSTYLVLTKSEDIMSAEMSASHTIDSKTLYLISLLNRHYLQPQALILHALECDFIQDEKGFW